MKLAKIEKSLGNQEITQEQIESIGKYSRRKLTKDELFVFSVILCDNDVDRDYEKFSKESLDKLAELFLGKTGIFDHMAKAENQSARIFSTEVVADGTKTVTDEDYYALKAYAYMVRCEKNDDLILEIDGGIKKEVSVGCSVEKVLCSVCGEDVKASSCGHGKGEVYSGVVCHHVLDNPTDAYEWSFVAVPAQRKAGVTKVYLGKSNALKENLIDKFYKNDKVTLSRSELKAIRFALENSSALVKAGEDYMGELKRGIVKNAAKVHKEMDLLVLEEVCNNMDLEQLKAFAKSYQQSVAKLRPLQLQLAPIEEAAGAFSQNQFKI